MKKYVTASFWIILNYSKIDNSKKCKCCMYSNHVNMYGTYFFSLRSIKMKNKCGRQFHKFIYELLKFHNSLRQNPSSHRNIN